MHTLLSSRTGTVWDPWAWIAILKLKVTHRVLCMKKALRYARFPSMMFFLLFVYAGAAHAIWLKESDVSDQQLSEELAAFKNAFNMLRVSFNEISSSNGEEQIRAIIAANMPEFRRLHNVESLFMAGLLELAQGAEQSEPLDAACKDNFLHALMLRGLNYLSRFNRSGDLQHLSAAMNDLRQASRNIIYYLSLDLAFPSRSLPVLPRISHFAEFIDRRSVDPGSLEPKLPDEQLLRPDNSEMYLGYYRQPYLDELRSRAIQEGTQRSNLVFSMLEFSSFITNRDFSFDFYKEFSVLIRRVVPEAIGIIGSPSARHEVIDSNAIIQGALWGLRETFVYAVSHHFLLSTNDLMLAPLASLLEQQFRLGSDQREIPLPSRPLHEYQKGLRRLRIESVMYNNPVRLYTRAYEELSYLLRGYRSGHLSTDPLLLAHLSDNVWYNRLLFRLNRQFTGLKTSVVPTGRWRELWEVFRGDADQRYSFYRLITHQPSVANFAGAAPQQAFLRPYMPNLQPVQPRRNERQMMRPPSWLPRTPFSHFTM